MNVPKLRFKEFNDEWKSEKLSELSSIIDGDRGKNYPKESEFFDNEYCLFLNAGNVTKQGFNFNNKLFITKEKDELLRNGKLIRNDIVLTTRGTVGNVALYDYNISYNNVRINSGMVVIRNNDKIIPKYLYSYMKSQIFENQVKKTNFGSAQPQLTIKGLEKLNIAYPDKAEQTKVSNFLSLLDKKIELQTKKIEDLKLFKKSLLNKLMKDIVPEKKCKLSDLGYSYSGISGKTKEDFNCGNAKYIPFINVLKNNIDIANLPNINIGFNEKQNKVKYNDLFFTISSETKEEVGMCAILKNNIDNVYLNSFCFGFRLKDKILINNEFLCYLLLSQKYRKIISNLGQGFTRVNISKNQLLDIDVEIPSINTQNRISNTISSLEKHINLEFEKLSKLNELKKGLMQNMFV